MANAMQIYEVAEILVQSNHDAVFTLGAFKQCPVTRVGANLSRIQDIVSLLTQPIRKSPSHAMVQQKLQDSATRTADRESPATTA